MIMTRWSWTYVVDPRGHYTICKRCRQAISKNLPFLFPDLIFKTTCSFRGLDLESNSLSAQGLHKDLHCDGGGIGIQRVNIGDSSLSLCLLVSSRTPFRRFHRMPSPSISWLSMLVVWPAPRQSRLQAESDCDFGHHHCDAYSLRI